jgi:hypothetical protein
MRYAGNAAGIRAKSFLPQLDKRSMNRVQAVNDAMVALQAPPPLSRLNVWLCVLLAAFLVLMLLASQNGGISALLARIRQALFRAPADGQAKAGQ